MLVTEFLVSDVVNNYTVTGSIVPVHASRDIVRPWTSWTAGMWGTDRPGEHCRALIGSHTSWSAGMWGTDRPGGHCTALIGSHELVCRNAGNWQAWWAL